MEQEEINELVRKEMISNATVENSDKLEENTRAEAEATPKQQDETIQQEGIDTTTEREINIQWNTNVDFEDHQNPAVTKVRKRILEVMSQNERTSLPSLKMCNRIKLNVELHTINQAAERFKLTTSPN